MSDPADIANVITETGKSPSNTNGDQVQAPDAVRQQALEDASNINGSQSGVIADSAHDATSETYLTAEAPLQNDTHERKESPVDASTRDHDDRNPRDRGERHGRGRGRGVGRRQPNIRARFDNLPQSKDADAIRRQVEFYFSDSNLPIDPYMLKLTGAHENKPVPLKIIHDFKRMHHFQPYSAVRDAMKGSKELKLNDDDGIIRRNPLPQRFNDDTKFNRKVLHETNMSRTIYAKGFGAESASTHIDIESFFEPYGPINSVRLRRRDSGDFKGSVFVEFEDEETRNKFLSLDPKPQYDNQELLIMGQKEYIDMKNKEEAERTGKPGSSQTWRERNPFDEESNDRRSKRERDQRHGSDARRRGDRSKRTGNKSGGGRRNTDHEDRKQYRDKKRPRDNDDDDDDNDNDNYKDENADDFDKGQKESDGDRASARNKEGEKRGRDDDAVDVDDARDGKKIKVFATAEA